MDAIGSDDMRKKQTEYAKFLNDVLRPDHISLELAREETQQEIFEYESLAKRLAEFSKDSTRTVDTDNVDLGHRKVFCRAKIEDKSNIFVHVGMGFHAELNIDEAISFARKRALFLTNNVLKHRTAKAEQVMTHIRSTEIILDELSNEIRRARPT